MLQNRLSRAANWRSISPQSQVSRKQRCQCCAVRPAAAEAAGGCTPQSVSGQLSVYAVSDLHTDYPANAAWVRQLPSFKQQAQHHTSCCIVAGDISDDLRVVRYVMQHTPAPCTSPSFLHCTAAACQRHHTLLPQTTRRDTFTALQSKFHLVAFTPGNHEAWVSSLAHSGLNLLTVRHIFL